MRQKRKHHFQLIEIAIAMFLILTCAIPVMNSYVHMYKEQRLFIRASEADHLAHLVHASLVEQLYQKQIPWSEIEGKVERDLQGDEDLMALLEKEGFKVKYHLEVIGKPRSNTKKFLVNLVFSILDSRLKQQEGMQLKTAKKLYSYLVYMQKDQPSQRGDEEEEEPNPNPAETPEERTSEASSIDKNHKQKPKK